MEMGKAISQKIREAIKAKLIDLGNYVDEELPDYIMVMIANKKTESQMKDDLALFLGANTDKFTGWLQSVLTKLQAAREEQKERKERAREKKKNKKKDSKKEKSRSVPRGAKEGMKDGTKCSTEKDKETESRHVTLDIAEKDTSKETNEFVAVQSMACSSQGQILPTHAPGQVEAEEQKSCVTTKQSPSSEPIISLLPDTNDILDEEIKMSESVRKVAANDAEPKVASVTHDECSSKTPVTLSSTVETSVPSKAVIQMALPKSPLPVSSTTREAQCGADYEESVAVRGSVKSRLGVPVVKRKIRGEERPRGSSGSPSVTTQTVSMKRKGPGSVIGQVITEDDSADEPLVKRVASTIKPCRRPALPTAKQSSMVLLKKAMSQAKESTSIFPAAGQFAEPIRMIVRSTDQSGSMKIVARSIPADMDHSSKVESGLQKKRLSRVMMAASKSVDEPRKAKKTSVTVRPLGLMSRSRFKEASERNFDAHKYQRVEGEGEPEIAEPENMESEENMREEEKEEEEIKEATTEMKEEVQDESLDDTEAEHQILEFPERILKTEGEEVVPLGVGLEEGDEDGSEEMKVMEISEPTQDTRTTTIVRPLQYDMLSRSHERASLPDQQPKFQSVLPTTDVNPRFIVTLEGKKRGPPSYQSHPQHNLRVSSYPYQPSNEPIPNIGVAHHKASQEVEEVEMVEDARYLSLHSSPSDIQEMILKNASVFQKDATIGRVLPTEHLIKEPVYTPPQLKVEPVSFSLQESDEEWGQGELEEKMNERCKFWPACKQGSRCPYIHPSTPCRTFPNCKFGDKCMFIHPNCKFDATCMNPSCPYTHATRTKPAPVIIHAPAMRTIPSFKPASTQTVCKFHPNCKNAVCPFLHPKMCLYGRACNRPNCKFTHSSVASRSSMTWTKGKHISERRFVNKSAGQLNHPS